MATPTVTAQAVEQASVVEAPTVQASAPSSLRIQAGAFSNEANAQRAVSQLSLAGQATIEPMTRSDGMTLYRVTLPAPADEAEAFALRDRVAEIGFVDARVVRPF
jgi:rare lipoprotein A